MEKIVFITKLIINYKNKLGNFLNLFIYLLVLLILYVSYFEKNGAY